MTTIQTFIWSIFLSKFFSVIFILYAEILNEFSTSFFKLKKNDCQ